MRPITVLLAEDHTMVREGFRAMLALERDIKVVGEAKDGRQAVAMTCRLKPEIVLMDIAMPLLNGLEATRQVMKLAPSTKVLVLSAHSDDAYIDTAIESGAAGFLLKQTSSSDVCRAIRDIQAGRRFFSPSISRRLRHLESSATRKFGTLKGRVAQLTSVNERFSS